ncbi:MAG: TonB-dependent siderophore receptor [Rhizobiales bacterium]|nr:TonB-dependent siderophore receptor [Hyphomicrobiales bacterium]
MMSTALAALGAVSILVMAHAEESQPSSKAKPGTQPAPSSQSPAVSLPPVSVRRPVARPKARPQRAKKAQPTRRVAAPPQVQQRPAGGSAQENGLGPVQGYAARQSVTATKTDTPILEVPQSISVITRDQIVSQQAQSLPEAVRYTPGVTTELYGASSFLDEVKVRGFDAPRFLDGLRLPTDTVVRFAQPKAEPYGLERFEILRGPSSGIYGHSSPGGLVNMVSKRPTDFHRGEVELQTGSFERLQGAFDLSGPLDEQRKFLGRIVGLARDTDRVIDFNHEKRLYIAPSFTWLPTPDTTFTFLASFLQDDIKGQPQQYLPAFGTLYPGPNGRLPYSRNIGEPNYDRVKLDQVLVGYEFTHRFNEVFQLRQNLRYGTVRNEVYSMRNESPAPGIFPNPPGYVLRSANYVFGDVKNLTVDTHVQADFRTGPFVHKVLFGIDYQKQKVTADYRSSFGSPPEFVPGFPINVYAPIYGQPIPGKNQMDRVFNTVADQDQAGLYLQDQIKVDRWVLTLTGRYDKAVADTTSLLDSTTVHQDDRAFTGRAGLTYLFDNGVAPYAAYSTSFQPAFGFSVANNNGPPFKPTTGKGWEAGVKYQPIGYRMLLTAAVFEVTQQNVLTPDPNDNFLQVQTGEVRVRGWELEARGNITRELAIVGGVSHIEPIVTKTTIAANVGKDLANVPRDSASLWAMYTFYDGTLGGLGLGAGVRYVGGLFGDEGNTFLVPSHTLFDAVVSYDFGYLRPDMKGLTLQINATNLFNKYYVANCFTGLAYCALGAPRTVLATLRYNWQEAERKDPRIVKARY